MAGDHYDVLGVAPDARHDEIRAAYRRLMRQHHPDRRPGDPAAEERAREVTAAWAVLGRPSARAAYDRRRAAARVLAPTVARPAAPEPAAYSPAGSEFSRAFHLASLRVAGVVLAVGVVVLAAISG